MSKLEEGSVAPAERVNIVYRPSASGAKEDVELPMKLLVAGDFTGKEDTRTIEEREPISIDKDNFNDVLKAHDCRLHLTVPNNLSPTPGSELDVDLSFASMADFAPDRIAAQIPVLKALLEVRDSLTALKGPLANVPEFRSKLQQLIKDEGARKQICQEIGIGSQEEHHD